MLTPFRFNLSSVRFNSLILYHPKAPILCPIATIALETLHNLFWVYKRHFPTQSFQFSSVRYPPAASMKEKCAAMHFAQRLMAVLPARWESNWADHLQRKPSPSALCCEKRAPEWRYLHTHTLTHVCTIQQQQLHQPHSRFPASSSSSLLLLQPHF